MTMTTAKRFEIQELRSNKPLAQPELDLARVIQGYITLIHIVKLEEFPGAIKHLEQTR